MQRLIKWYEKQMKKLGVEVKQKTEATPELIKELKPEVVVLATGSEPIVPQIPGVEYAVLADDVLSGKVEVGDNIVIIGGGMVGCELGIELAKKGKNVTIVEALDAIVPNEPAINQMAINKLLVKYNVRIRTGSPVIEIHKGEVEIVDRLGRRRSISADSVVIAVGRKPVVPEELISEAKKIGKEVYIIGDAKVPRKVIDAIREGFSVAIDI